eukprot:gene7484-9793_t
MGCAASSSVQPALLKHSQSRLFNGKKKDTWPGIFATLTDSNDDFVSNTEYKNDIISFPEEINKADNEPESMVNSYFESLAATDIDESGWNILLILGGPNSDKGNFIQTIIDHSVHKAYVFTAEQLLLEHFMERAGIGSVRDAFDIIARSHDSISMDLVFDLLVQKIKKMSVSDGTLVLLDPIPNLRIFARTPLLRAVNKQLETVEITKKKVQFAIYVESYPISMSDMKSVALPEEGDTKQLQKRSKMHETNCIPLIRYFESSKRLITIKASSLKNDILHPMPFKNRAAALLHWICSAPSSTFSHFEDKSIIFCFGRHAPEMENFIATVRNITGGITLKESFVKFDGIREEVGTCLLQIRHNDISGPFINCICIDDCNGHLDTTSAGNCEKRYEESYSPSCLYFQKTGIVKLTSRCSMDAETAQIHVYEQQSSYIFILRSMWENEKALLRQVLLW